MTLVVTLVCLWLVGIGLEHVLTKNRIHAIGRHQREVEAEIADLDQNARSFNLKIEEALSRQDLMEKLADRRTKLKKIQPENIIHLYVKPPRAVPVKDPNTQ